MATSQNPPPDILSVVCDALKDRGVTICNTLAELAVLKPANDVRARVTAGLVLNPTLQIRYYDVKPGILVYDPLLYTLGLVDAIGPTENLETALSTSLDRAAQVRQLCLSLAAKLPHRALTTELVIVIPKEIIARAAEIAGTVFRKRAKETGYFEVLGVGLLFERSSGGFQDDDLTRAFPWLLSKTREWFLSKTVNDHAAKSEVTAGLTTITLENYRLSGKRSYHLAGEPRFHVLHGYNGSGKSSLTEAIELLMTGHIERIDDAGEKRYFPVVRYKRAELPVSGGAAAVAEDESPAVVSLEVQDGLQDGRAPVNAKVTVFRTDPTPEPVTDRSRVWSPEVTSGAMASATSFRLDQILIDSLVRANDSNRAAVFIKAFFPKDKPLYDQLQQAMQTADAALKELPKQVTDLMGTVTDKIAWAAENLLWTEQAPETWTAPFLDVAKGCLPVTLEQLDLLAQFSHSLQPIVANLRKPTRTPDTAESELTRVDDGLRDARTPAAEAQAHLKTAIEVLPLFEKWIAQGRREKGIDFETDLRKWLRLQALVDLVSKQYEVIATLAAARAKGWEPLTDAERMLARFEAAQADARQFEETRRALVEQAAVARGRVERWGLDTAESASESDAATAPPRRLRPNEVVSLNRVGGWLPSLRVTDPSSKGFGDLFDEAIEANEKRTRGTFTIGSGDLQRPINEAKELLAACERVTSLKPDRSDGAVALFARCREAHRKAVEVLNLQKQVNETFLAQVKGTKGKQHQLVMALNEVRALFKPAPWAYQDLSLQSGAAGTTVAFDRLGVRTADDARAELRLNTAELNAFTLALFFLCAPAQDNPLRLLVLDDPLQNMDEMTVSAVARGLAKLMRIYPPGWRIAALFHGEDHLNRMIAEVPSGVYRLPWLSPSPNAVEQKPVSSDGAESTWNRAQQLIADLRE